MPNWYAQRFHRRAVANGEDWFGKHYTGGEFLPFYVPRPKMPQIDFDCYPDLMAFALSKQVGIVEIQVTPNRLRAHQMLDPFRPSLMPEGVDKKPVLVSLDMFILDGNHRWMQHMFAHTPIWALQIQRNFEEAIAFMFEFPKTYTLEYHTEGN